ncbi:MAG: Hint domain-containing protein [Pseudomonadota bacterium]
MISGANTATFAEIEVVTATAQNDELNFGAKSDGATLDGAAGDDVITGGSGNDVLYGGDGSDTIALQAGFGADALYGGEGGSDSDTLDLSALGTGVTATFTGAEDGIVTDGTDTATFFEIENLILTTQADMVDVSNDATGRQFDALAGDDSLVGGAGDDSFEGNLGNDTLSGGAGNDLIYGGAGNDSLSTGTGNDTLFGGAGNDTLSNSAGNDTLDGGTGDDTLIATLGDDLIYGGDGDDSALGGADNDTIYAGDGNDRIDGEAGDDLIYGGNDQDTIVLTDGFGDDTVYGGEGGNDVDTLDLSTLGSGVTVTFSGAESGTITDGTDTVTFFGVENFILTGQEDSLVGTFLTSAVDITVSGGDGNDTLTGHDGQHATDDIFYGGSGNDTLVGLDGDDELYGGDGDDSIDGEDWEDTLYGGAGNDIIEAGEEETIGNQDLVYGGDGNDTITSVETDARSDDTFFGGDGNDSISVAGGDNTLYGGSGADNITGGLGNDSVYAGDDADTIALTDGFGSDTIYGGESGNDNDTLDLSGLGSNVTVTYTGDEQGTFTDGTDTAAFFGIENVILTDQNDFLDATNDTVGIVADGRDGEDTIIGGSGDDVLYGGNNADSIIGGGGNDTLYGGDNGDDFELGAGDDVIYSGAGTVYNRLVAADGFGQDTVYGGGSQNELDFSSLSNSVTGTISDDGDGTLSDGTSSVTFQNVPDLVLTSGNDQLSLVGLTVDLDDIYAGDGDDTITGIIGSQDIYGGEGRDTFSFADATTATTRVYGGEGGIDGDTLDFSARTTGVSLFISGDGSSANAVGIFAQEFEDYVFTNVDDVITVWSTSGSITVDAGAGNDTISSGQSGNLLYGGDGNDVFNDLGGSDTLFGGSDSDTFLVSDGFGSDTIYGGDSGTDSDTLDLSALGSGVTVTFTGDEQGTFTDGTGTANFFGIENVILTDQNDALDASNDTVGVTVDAGTGDDSIIGDDGADVVYGGAGNDRLSAGDSEDTLYGGSGNDTLFGGAGNDTLTGGTGNDTFAVDAAGGSDIITDFGVGDDQLNTTALTDVGNALTNQDGTVTADEVTVTGGGGADQVLTFPSGESVAVPDGTVDTTSQQTQFASLVAMGVPPCFAPGTKILTVCGPRAVETLQVGDLVVTADHGPQPLRWIGRRDIEFSAHNPRGTSDKPIMISRGALDAGPNGPLPQRDLIVSPQHRMVLSGPDVAAELGAPEVMALAKALTTLQGVRQMKGKRRVSYLALLFDRHEVIFAEGAPTESFRPGPVALAHFAPEHRAQVLQIYPGLEKNAETALGSPVRPIVSRKAAKRLLSSRPPRSEMFDAIAANSLYAGCGTFGALVSSPALNLVCGGPAVSDGRWRPFAGKASIHIDAPLETHP